MEIRSAQKVIIIKQQKNTVTRNIRNNSNMKTTIWHLNKSLKKYKQIKVKRVKLTDLNALIVK